MKLQKAFKNTEDQVREFFLYEKEKIALKEGFGDTNMRRAERQIEQIETAFDIKKHPT